MAAVTPPKIYTVSDLTTEVRALLEDSFAGIWVEGELSNFRHHSSGHMYFTLKDQESQIRAVMFRQQNRQLRFQLRDGLAILVYGELSVYEPRGGRSRGRRHRGAPADPRDRSARSVRRRRLQAEGL